MFGLSKYEMKYPLLIIRSFCEPATIIFIGFSLILLLKGYANIAQIFGT